MGYQIAGVLGGGIAPIVAISLYERFGTPFAVSGYVLAMAVLTVVALAFAPENAGRDLDELDAREELDERAEPDERGQLAERGQLQDGRGARDGHR
jgi:hypothetical protein